MQLSYLAVQSERKPATYGGLNLSSDRSRDKESSPPLSLQAFTAFEQQQQQMANAAAHLKTPVVGKDIPSMPPTSIAELQLQMVKALEKRDQGKN